MVTGRKKSALIRAYFKNGCLGKKDFLFAALHKRLPYIINAGTITDMCIKNPVSKNLENTPVKIDIKPYNGHNPFARKMMSYLDKHLKPFIVGAYAHGSVGNSEEVAYSDFDAFIIIKDQVFQHPGTLKRVAVLLSESEIIMTDMDPLQHHGWFILTESELENYPEDYLPHELWQHATTLYGATQLQVHINPHGYHDELIAAYHKFSSHLLRNLRSQNFLNDNYSLKSVLSGFMLLPSIYLQAKTGKPVFKKYSFEKVRNTFGDACKVMDEVSAIRTAWNYKPSAFYTWLLKYKPFLLSYLLKKRKSGKVDPELKEKLNKKFVKEMIAFVEMLNKNMLT